MIGKSFRAKKLGLEQIAAYGQKLSKCRLVLKSLGVQTSQGNVLYRYLKNWKDCR